MNLVAVATNAVIAFACTNLDDFALLVGWFSDQSHRPAHIALGQIIGLAILIAVSTLAALVALVLPKPIVGLLGIIPVLVGIARLLGNRKRFALQKTPAAGTLAVAGVTVANGGDNIAIYTPLLAAQTSIGIALVIIVLLLMSLIWIAAANWFVSHPAWGPTVRRWGLRVAPWLLIALGLNILYQAGSIDLLD